MSQVDNNKSDTDVFPFKIYERSSTSVGLKESYNLDLLGFTENTAMLTLNSNRNKKQSNEISQNPPLEGTQVIIKFNSTPGKNSLLFNRKNGKQVEIPTSHCSFYKVVEPLVLKPEASIVPSDTLKSNTRTVHVKEIVTNCSIDHAYTALDKKNVKETTENFQCEKRIAAETNLEGKSQQKNTKQLASKGTKRAKVKDRYIQILSKSRKLACKETSTDEYLLSNYVVHKLPPVMNLVHKLPPVKNLVHKLPPVENLAQEAIAAQIQDINSVEKNKESSDTNSAYQTLPSPLPLVSFEEDIFYGLDGILEDSPIMGENANFGTGPVMEPLHVPEIRSLLERPIISNDYEKCRVLFFLDLRDCNKLDHFGNAPIHIAVMENNLNRVKRQCFALKLRRFSIDLRNIDNLTPLQLGVYHNVSASIIHFIRNLNADATVSDSDGNSILHLAVLYSDIIILQTILLNCNGLDFDATNFDGFTALILCVLNKQYEKAKVLLSAGFDPNVSDKKSGRTPLFYAVEANDVQMVKILMQYKAGPKVRNFGGVSPYEALFELQNVDEAIKKLVFNKDYRAIFKRKQRAEHSNNSKSKGSNERNSRRFKK